eukprot:jgi/Ulvmu1/4379/UM002_0104.1
MPTQSLQTSSVSMQGPTRNATPQMGVRVQAHHHGNQYERRLIFRICRSRDVLAGKDQMHVLEMPVRMPQARGLKKAEVLSA